MNYYVYMLIEKMIFNFVIKDFVKLNPTFKKDLNSWYKTISSPQMNNYGVISSFFKASMSPNPNNIGYDFSFHDGNKSAILTVQFDFRRGKAIPVQIQ